MFRLFKSLQSPKKFILRNPNFLSTANFATYKTTTGLAGLPVDENGKETILKLSADVLQAVKKIPETSQYRIDVEKWFNFITRTASSTDDVKAIEDEIGIGQIEEIIDIAKDELELIDYYHEHRGWELVAEAQKTADAMLEELSDSIYFADPSKGQKAA